MLAAGGHAAAATGAGPAQQRGPQGITPSGTYYACYVRGQKGRGARYGDRYGAVA